MDRETFIARLHRNRAGIDRWASRWGPFELDPSQHVAPERLEAVMNELVQRLHDNYPYMHPRYAGQMLKPPHPVAMLAYATAMQINPNNHALDSSMATSLMEKEVIAELARMFGYVDAHLGHLTAGGTIANLEALWIARSLQPEKAIVFSDQAHYTHGRACELLNAAHLVAPTDEYGRLDLVELRLMLASGAIGTVVATVGTTGLGSVDPIHEIIPMARAAGARVHVDAAYGGFFTLLAHQDPSPLDARPFLALAEADSLVVDPHKHGLQPYGCGAVLFRDPTVGRFYAHDSPYTYFTSDDLHLGEISLECSRAGASAAALWATLQCFPLAAEDGLGAILGRSREAALYWAAMIRAHPRLELVVQPELDILNFYAVPVAGDIAKASDISALTERIFAATMADPVEPIFLAVLTVERRLLEKRTPSIVWDVDTLSVLRSVVMKPEHAAWIPELQTALERHLD
jgi:glutamate/tyrosine decarboxylase-like PLP-dependent enzyme